MTYLLILNVLCVAIPAALLGVLLMNRKAIMVADAISHSVLPGIVVAYLLSPTKNNFSLFIGAIVCGIMTTLLIDFFNKRLRLAFDVSIGILFPALFAIGLILLSKFGGLNSDIDQECVLFGDLETTVLELITLNERVIGTAFFFRLLSLLIVVLLLIGIGFRSWQAWLFNADFTLIKGFKVNSMQLLLMLLLSVFSVLSFEGVGVVMVLGLLVLPAASAYLFSKSLKENFIFAVCLGILSSILGVLLGVMLDISVAPCVTLVNAVVFNLLLVVKYLRKRIQPAIQKT